MSATISIVASNERPAIELGNVVVAFRLREPLFAVPGITEREVRQAVADEIERLIVLMDAFDGDADAEPSLGAAECHPGPGWWAVPGDGSQARWGQSGDDDRESGDVLDGGEQDHCSESPAQGHRSDRR